MRRIDPGSKTRAKKAAKASRRTHHGPSQEDRFVTEAMAPRSVFVPPTLIKKPGRQFDPTPNPAKRYQPVGPAPKAKKGAKKTFTPYERALGRPLGIDIEHQQRNELIKPSKATPKAAAAAASRSHTGAAQVLTSRADWKPRKSNFGKTLSEVGGAVAGVGRYAWEHQGAIQHPDEAIRNRVISDASQAAQGDVEPAAKDIEFASGINPRHPLKQGPYALAANAAMLGLPEFGRVLGGAAKLGRAIAPEHEQALQAVEQATKSLRAARETGHPETIAAAKEAHKEAVKTVDVLTKAHNGKPLHGIEGRTPTEPVQGPKTFEEDAAARIQGQKPVRGRIQAGYRPQRAAKFKAYDEAYDLAISRGYDPGTASTLAKRELKGKLTKVGSRAMEGLGEPERQRYIAKIHEVLKTSSPERARAVEALNAAFKGTVPTRSEITLLEKVFPKAEVEKVVQNARGPRKMLDLFFDMVQIPRTMQSTGDVSALFRQALPVFTRHPGLWREALSPSFKAMKSEKQFAAHYDKLWENPATQDFVDAGGAIQDVGNRFQGGARVEEAFGSASAEKLPVVGHAARQYTSFLNDLRMQMWDHLLPQTEKLAARQAARKGLDHEAAIEKAHKDLARYINSMTGRGPLKGHLNTAAPVLNGVFFSPRLLASRIDLLLSPITYARATPYVRRQAMRSTLQLAAVGTGVLAAASQIPGVDVGMNPLSSDFGRIRIGDTRIDIFGGFQPVVKLMAQFYAGEVVSSMSGKKEQLNKGTFGGNTRLSLTMKFLREKLSPNGSFVIDWMDGQDVVGNKFEWSKQWQRIVPMLAMDIADTVKYKGPHANPALVGGLGSLGFSTMTYGPKKKKGKKFSEGRGSTGGGFTEGGGGSSGGGFTEGGG